MIGVIKANAYGHGAVPVAHLMEGKDYIWGYAVANVPEAEELRDAGFKKTYTDPRLCLSGRLSDTGETGYPSGSV